MIEDFNADQVGKMIEFLYTGDYSSPLQEAQETQDGVAPELENLLQHVHMNGIADYYDIKPLATLSREKLQAAYSPEGTALLDAATEALRKTGDAALHGALAEATAGKLRQFLDAEQLVELVGPFGVAVLNHMVFKEDKLHSMIASLRSELEVEQIRLRTAEARSQRVLSTSKQVWGCCGTPKSAGISPARRISTATLSGTASRTSLYLRFAVPDAIVGIGKRWAEWTGSSVTN